MKKYKFLGPSEFAKQSLCVDDLESLQDMTGCEIEDTDKLSEIDGGKLFLMPDGEEAHIIFLDLELIVTEKLFQD